MLCYVHCVCIPLCGTSTVYLRLMAQHSDNVRNGFLLGGALMAATGLWLAVTMPTQGTSLFAQAPPFALAYVCPQPLRPNIT